MVIATTNGTMQQQEAAEHDRLVEQLHALFDRYEPHTELGKPVPSRRSPESWEGRDDPRALAGYVAGVQRLQQLRAKFFDKPVLAEPAWPMILDLFMAALMDKPVTTKQLTIAGDVPGTTALRWISILVEAGYAERYNSDTDRRLALLRITERGFTRMEGYFQCVRDLVFGAAE